MSNTQTSHGHNADPEPRASPLPLFELNPTGCKKPQAITPLVRTGVGNISAGGNEACLLGNQLYRTALAGRSTLFELLNWGKA